MVLFNMVSIKAGGGQQNALSFLENIVSLNLGFDYIVACTESTLVYDFCLKNHIRYIVVKQGVLSRLKYELLFEFLPAFKKYKIEKIFTIFGSAPLMSLNVYKISGCAYSNIFQPEVDIWGYMVWYKRILKKCIDLFRLFSLLQSDEIILETHYLKDRAVNILKNKKVSVIEMAPSKLVTDKLKLVEDVNLDKDIYTLLCLSGAQPNKRIAEFLDVLFFLNKEGVKKYKFYLTPLIV